MKFIEYLQSKNISSDQAARELSTDEHPVSESAVRKWMYRERTPRAALIQRIWTWSDENVGPADWFETSSSNEPDSAAQAEARA